MVLIFPFMSSTKTRLIINLLDLFKLQIKSYWMNLFTELSPCNVYLHISIINETLGDLHQVKWPSHLNHERRPPSLAHEYSQ